MGFLRRHWSGIATFAVSTAVFLGVVALLPEAAPVLAVMAIAGFASGLVGALVGDLLERKKPGLDLLFSAVLSSAISMATFGLGRALAPTFSKVLARFVAANAGKAIADAVHPPEPSWLAARIQQSIEGAKGADPKAVATFLHETYEHVNEVNAILDEMGAPSHPIPRVEPEALPQIHDFVERAPIERVEELANRPGAPDWIREAAAAARARGDAFVDVSKLEPHVSGGLSTSPPDPMWPRVASPRRRSRSASARSRRRRSSSRRAA